MKMSPALIFVENFPKFQLFLAKKNFCSSLLYQNVIRLLDTT